MNKKILFLTIALFFLIVISLFFYFQNKEEEIVDVEYEVQEEEIKKNLVSLKQDLVNIIPEKYEVRETDSKSMYFVDEEDGKCVFLYEIFPKEYSEIEKEYLENANIFYCEDINTTVLRGQIEEVRYDQTEGKWFFASDGIIEDPLALDVEQFGKNLVSIAPLGGSHASRAYYIVRLDGSDELVVLSIPTWNRIRCDALEDGVEKENCENFLASVSTDFGDSVPEEVYEGYYNDLLVILGDIF